MFFTPRGQAVRTSPVQNTDMQLPVTQGVFNFFIRKRNMKKRIAPLLIMSLLAILVLGACNSQAAPTIEAAITLSDGLGREVILSQPATKIVSIAPSNTEILYAIGAGDLLIGRDENSNYPQEALEVENLGGGVSALNLEQLTALQPDLVLAAQINAPETVDALEKTGLTVYYLSNPDDFEGLYENIKTVGVLTGHETEANALAQSLRSRVENLLAKIMLSETRPTIFFELDATEPAKPWTSGGGTFVDYLITMAGAENIAGTLESEWAQYSQEDLILQDPDIIILADSKWGVTVDMVKERPGWEALSAVQNGAIYLIDDDLTSRPGPRLVDGLEALAVICHPELDLND
jgi:iron complex transport system substrate-binding protein